MNDKIECPWCGIFGMIPTNNLRHILSLIGKKEGWGTCETCGNKFLISIKEEEKE